jgi:anti-anti-sigma factor
MRRKVPFVGEEQITRADDEEAQAKKDRGHLIDDVIGTQRQASSWDDLVSSDYPDPLGEQPRIARPHAAIPKSTRPKIVPVTPGPVLKKAIMDVKIEPAKVPVANGASIDWLPINSGHGLRINISGSLDQGMHNEWRRLIAETEANGVGQFEFNLTDAPNLTLTGLGMLLHFKEQKGSERGDIKLCHCNREVWQMLQWTGMDKYFTIQGRPGS